MTTLDQRDPEELRSAIAEAQAAGDLPALRSIVEGLEAALAWRPQEYQLPPDGDWWSWVFSGGAGAGKTDVGAWWVDEHVKGPPCDLRLPGGHRVLLAGPTFSDAITTQWKAPAGLSVHNPSIELVGRKEGTVALWPDNGHGRAEGLFVGLHTEHDSELLRARAANCCSWWVDEAALARHLKLALDMIQLRARAGARPRGIVTSTPKATLGWKYLLGLPNVAVTYGSSYQNVHLSPLHKARLARFRGTRLEAQEVHGRLVDDFEGALWNRDRLDRWRVRDFPQQPLERVAALGVWRSVVGIDPSTWDPEIGEDPGTIAEGLETGLVVVGIGPPPPGWTPPAPGISGPHVYVFEDASLRGSAEEWGRAACNEYHRWECSDVVPETNAGGSMVLSTIALVDRNVHVYRGPTGKPGVRAALGKRARAEPSAALWEQGRGHIVGELPALEGQLCQWDPRESWSPDRLDAFVWGVEAVEPWVVTGSGSVLDAM